MSIIHIPWYKYRNTEQGAFPWEAGSLLLPSINIIKVLCQYLVSAFVFLSCGLGMFDCHLHRDGESPDGPSSLSLSLLFLPLLRDSHRCGATAGRTRLPTPFLYDFCTNRMWVYFSFSSSPSGAITQHCSPNRDRHRGCVLVRWLGRLFAVPALLAASSRRVGIPPQPPLDGHHR